TLFRSLAVLPAQLAAAGRRHGAGAAGDGVAHLVAARGARDPRALRARDRGVRAGLDRAVRRPPHRRPQTELSHRPGLSPDRAGVGAVQDLSPHRLALVGRRIAAMAAPTSRCATLRARAIARVGGHRGAARATMADVPTWPLPDPH